MDNLEPAVVGRLEKGHALGGGKGAFNGRAVKHGDADNRGAGTVRQPEFNQVDKLPFTLRKG
ncbi:MAG: hypothetical protein DSY57_04695 [Desulfobulbus sp.]|nr:MAG: hypothetical protein DSY57_04695 [Desulfobulbus sp.]